MEAPSTVSTSSSDSSRADARSALRQAAAAMPLTSSVGTTAGGKTVASFRPSRTRKPTTTPQAEVTQATALKHPLPTSERVDGLLIQTVLRNLDRGKSREEALAYTRNWLSAEVIGKSGDLTSVDREARLAQVKNLDVAAFWAAIDAKIAAKAKPQAPSPSDRPRPMADKPKTTPVRTTPASLASAALLAAFACANQMTAGDDEPEVTTGRDMEIPDEKPAPMIVTKPRTAAPTSNPRDNSGTPKPRVLMRLPLTTPGHVEDMVTLFTERNLANGMSADRALSSACGRVFSIIEKDESLSDGEMKTLKERVQAKLPKRGPAHRPLTDAGRVEELLLRFAIQATEKGYDRPEAAGEATDRVMAIVHREVADAELEPVLDRMKNWLQTSFTQPLVEDGGASLEEIEQAVRLSKDIFEVSHDEFFEGPKKTVHRHHGKRAFRAEPAPAVREARMDVPKTSKPNPMTREEQEKRAAKKKAERAKRAEASAKASRDISPGMLEKPGDSKRAARAKAATKSKKGESKKKGGKKQAEARAE